MKLTDKIEVLNADCMEVMATYPDKYFDLAVVDPPYGLDDWNDRGINKSNFAKKHMDLQQIKTFENKAPMQNYFNELFRISKNQIIWGGNHFLDYLGSTKQMIVWDKMIRGMHFNDCEIAWVSQIKEACRIYTQSANDNSRIHPTQKPIKLYDWIFKNYAEQGMKILDTHGGSMSSVISADKAGLEMVCCELDKEYFDKAVDRFKKYKSQNVLEFK